MSKETRLKILYRCAHLFEIKGEINKAIETYTKIIKLNPKENKAFAGRGRLRVKLKKYKAALADYANAIIIDMNDPQISKEYHDLKTFIHLNKHIK